MNVRSLISEPYAFQGLQDSIEATFGSVKPGVRVEIFEKKLSEFKNYLYQFLSPPSFDTSSITIGELRVLYRSDTMMIVNLASDLSLSDAVDEASYKMVDAFAVGISNAIEDSPLKDDSDAILYSTVSALQDAGIASNISFVRDESNIRKLAKVLFTFMLSDFKRHLASLFPRNRFGRSSGQRCAQRIHNLIELGIFFCL